MKKFTEYGNRLRVARKLAGLTQKELEAISGVSQVVISKIERGDQENSAYDAILAHHLGVSAYWLSTGEGDKDACIRSGAEFMMVKAFRLAQSQGVALPSVQQQISHAPQ